jgi:hypothetical protein
VSGTFVHLGFSKSERLEWPLAIGSVSQDVLETVDPFAIDVEPDASEFQRISAHERAETRVCEVISKGRVVARPSSDTQDDVVRVQLGFPPPLHKVAGSGPSVTFDLCEIGQDKLAKRHKATVLRGRAAGEDVGLVARDVTRRACRGPWHARSSPKGPHALASGSQLNQKRGGMGCPPWGFLAWWGRLGWGVPRGETKAGEARHVPCPTPSPRPGGQGETQLNDRSYRRDHPAGRVIRRAPFGGGVSSLLPTPKAAIARPPRSSATRSPASTPGTPGRGSVPRESEASKAERPPLRPFPDPVVRAGSWGCFRGSLRRRRDGPYEGEGPAGRLSQI